MLFRSLLPQLRFHHRRFLPQVYKSLCSRSSGLNFWALLGALKGAAYGVQFACSMRSFIVAAVTGDAEEFLLALSNGIVSFVGLIGICETHFAVQILTKALAAYGVKENSEKFLNAVKKGDAAEILVSGLNLTIDDCHGLPRCLPVRRHD